LIFSDAGSVDACSAHEALKTHRCIDQLFDFWIRIVGLRERAFIGEGLIDGDADGGRDHLGDAVDFAVGHLQRSTNVFDGGLRGHGVKGDDQDLAKAVKKDINGFSFNNLGFIYDINTRKQVVSIAIIPIDLNENGKIDADEKIYSTLDDVLNYAEKTKNPKLPAENVNAIFRKNSRKDVTDFLQWILTKGQQYDHEYGFLHLDASIAESERQLLLSFNQGYSCAPSARNLIKNAITKK